MPEFDYVAGEFAKLEPADFHRIKVASDTAGRTHWLRVSPAALAKIQEIIAADQKD